MFSYLGPTRGVIHTKIEFDVSVIHVVSAILMDTAGVRMTRKLSFKCVLNSFNSYSVNACFHISGPREGKSSYFDGHILKKTGYKTFKHDQTQHTRNANGGCT